MLVESGIPEISRSSNLEIALYAGMINLFLASSLYFSDVITPYPFTEVDTYPEFLVYGMHGHFQNWAATDFTQAAQYTLRLTHLKQLYDRNLFIDTNCYYEMDLLDEADIQTGNIFEYDGNRYIPVKFEREISDKKGLVKGFFLRLL